MLKALCEVDDRGTSGSKQKADMVRGQDDKGKSRSTSDKRLWKQSEYAKMKALLMFLSSDWQLCQSWGVSDLWRCWGLLEVANHF